MNHSILAGLDQAELLHLALKAGTADDGASAIAYLKEAVSRADASAQAHYLLGAEYAQLKMFDRAGTAMEAALALDPALHTARLQLALTFLTLNDEPRAASVLAPLADVGVPPALQFFGSGLLQLIAGELAAARQALELGIAQNSINLPLNGDMQHIVAEISARLDSGAAPDQSVDAVAPAATVDAEPDGQHLLLSAYAGNIKH